MTIPATFRGGQTVRTIVTLPAHTTCHAAWSRMLGRTTITAVEESVRVARKGAVLRCIGSALRRVVQFEAQHGTF
jgi:hypothetical protein